MSEDDILLTHILKCQPIDLILKKPVLSALQQDQLRSYKQRRQQGEPLQYILGEWDFCGLTMRVSPDVLIPRPETEQMVAHGQSLFEKERKLLILDIATGSGCIAIALAKHYSNAKVMAIDISHKAISVAQENAMRHGVYERINFIVGDMRQLEAIVKESQFDLIISNPPYIPISQMGKLPKEVSYEPRLALDGGEDGLDFIRILIKSTERLLTRTGYLMMEFGDGQSEQVFEISRVKFNDVQIGKDLALRDRFVICYHLKKGYEE